jgi:hypothetical protein
MQKKLLSLSLLCIFSLSVLSLSTLGANATEETSGVIITPSYIEDTLYPGEVEYDTITVQLPESVPKGDVIFLFDVTGSMGGVLSTVKSKAINIMNGIRGAIPDTEFGVGSFGDYPGRYISYGYNSYYGGSSDYPFNMDQDITADTTAITTAINSLYARGGSDGPESYTRAVWESMHYSWRDGAKRIVVIFGDAPPHAAPSGQTLKKPWAPLENLFSVSHGYGGDPGPDAIMFTADDLDYGPVVQQAADNQITFISVDSQRSFSGVYANNAHANFDYIANITDGARFFYTSSTIANDIIVRIQAIAEAPIDELTLAPTSSWVSWSPAAYYDVEWGSTVSFDVEVTIPEDTTPGDYTIEIDVVADGVTLGTVTILKHILDPIIPVDVDIKPGSWPNPINVKNRGVFAVAILGTEDFDVTTINPESIEISIDGSDDAVAPLRWSYEDVATPYIGEDGGGHDLNGDGYLDLVVHFSTQDVVNMLNLGDYAGSTIPLVIDGLLNDDAGGTAIQGYDYVRVQAPGKNK